MRIIVAGIGTDVGKTAVSSILSLLFKADYWKPIQCGDDSMMPQGITVHPPAYTFKAPLSPHHAARLENTTINWETIIPPQTTCPLIIESIGGIFVPLTTNLLSIDLFQSWHCQWVVVSKHYLGSINHTLLTIEVLKWHQIPLLGLIFNGMPHPDTEEAILNITQLPLLGRLLPEPFIDQQVIKRYVKQWQTHFR